MNKEQRTKFYKSATWRRKRQEILHAGNYECEWCKLEGKVTTRQDAVLEIDHIKELKDYPELALESSNLRILCRTCHNKRHDRFFTRKKRKATKWEHDERW